MSSLTCRLPLNLPPRGSNIGNFKFFSLICSEPLGIGMKSPAVIACDERPDSPPSARPTCPTRSRALALAQSAQVHPVRLTEAPSAPVSPTRRSTRLTRPGLVQSGLSALPASPSAASALDLSAPPFAPISEEDDFNDLFRRSTQSRNSKADPKGKGKADPNHPEKRPKVCYSSSY